MEVMITFTLRPLCPQGKSVPDPLNRRLSEPPELVWTNEETNLSSLTRIEYPISYLLTELCRLVLRWMCMFC
jgi:hypothetical protein